MDGHSTSQLYVIKNLLMVLAVRIYRFIDPCIWEVWSALKKLELRSNASLSCSLNFPRAPLLDIRTVSMNKFLFLRRSGAKQQKRQRNVQEV